MKVYILNKMALPKNIVFKKGGAPQLIKKTTTHTIFSTEGIFQIHKNKLMRLEIIDVQCRNNTILIDDIEYDFIIDCSKFRMDEECMQLPLEHSIEYKIIYEYSLRPGAQVHFVVEHSSDSGEMKDIYFLANDDINLQLLNEEIVSFLSQLNLC